MDTGRNVLSDDEAKALREIIKQQEGAEKITVAPVRGSSKTAEALWAALERAEKQAQQIKERLTEIWLTPSREELLTGAHIEHKEPTAAEMHERARREFELHEAGRRVHQEPLERLAKEIDRRIERLAKEIDRRIERLLTERYPGTPIEAFVSSFIPGGLRITAPDGAAFDFVYKTHGPSTVDGATTMTMELTVTEAKEGGERE